MNDTTKTNQLSQWANYYEIKNIHMDEIKRLRRQNSFLTYFIAGTVSLSAVLTVILAHQIFFA